MPYGYSLENLLVLLHKQAPAKADAVALHRRRVELGLLSVGLKLHCLGNGTQFSTLLNGLGGSSKILGVNLYKNSGASLCLVLPPVGSARTAILLLECIEQSIESPLFGNPEIQIQVCSPGRLSPRRAALLAIAFYLGSDTLRRYSLAELETTFTTHRNYPRGKRLVLYDADGDFDAEFDWWKRSDKDRLVVPRLPVDNGRSDLLAGSASRLDIENINLLATLLIHAQYEGYWKALGQQFEQEMGALLDQHLLAGLADAPWVRTDDLESGDRVRRGHPHQGKRPLLDIELASHTGQVVARYSAGGSGLASKVPWRAGPRLSPIRPRRSDMIRAQQPGSQPLDIPETIPNPVVIPAEPRPAPVGPAPREPAETPEKLPAGRRVFFEVQPL